MKIAIWNIGHFSGGNGKNTTITEELLETQKTLYRDYIYREIQADIFCVCEHSSVFCNVEKGPNSGPVFAKDILFDVYPVHYEGTQYNYSANAIFSKTPADVTCKRFHCNDTATFVLPKPISPSDYYYLKATITLDGTPITLIVCHLAFDNGRNPDTINTDQLHELVEVTNAEDRVIMVGDFNCHDFENFNILTAAGYTLGNDGSIVTRPQEEGNRALDNIIAKGVSITNFRSHATTLSDHYALSADITLI